MLLASVYCALLATEAPELLLAVEGLEQRDEEAAVPGLDSAVPGREVVRTPGAVGGRPNGSAEEA